MPELALQDISFESRAVSPYLEMGAYEALWEDKKETFTSISRRFAERPGAIPSNFVSEARARACAHFVRGRMEKADVKRFGVQVNGAGDYPLQLRDAKRPVELLYFQGWWDLVSSRSVAVVGTRKPTKAGILRARSLVQHLVGDDFTVVSGLAAGIDREAHKTAIKEGGRTIAVLGTPLSHAYPKENADLQKQLAEQFLVVSQVPFKRYESQDYRRNRTFFPERNMTMSALTEATIIVEAGETSGTLFQAREALHQGRKLFILDSNFRNPRLTWPAKFEKRGAIRVREYEDIRGHLAGKTH